MGSNLAAVARLAIGIAVVSQDAHVATFAAIPFLADALACFLVANRFFGSAAVTVTVCNVMWNYFKISFRFTRIFFYRNKLTCAFRIGKIAVSTFAAFGTRIVVLTGTIATLLVTGRGDRSLLVASTF